MHHRGSMSTVIRSRRRRRQSWPASSPRSVDSPTVASTTATPSRCTPRRASVARARSAEAWIDTPASGGRPSPGLSTIATAMPFCANIDRALARLAVHRRSPTTTSPSKRRRSARNWPTSSMSSLSHRPASPSRRTADGRGRRADRRQRRRPSTRSASSSRSRQPRRRPQRVPGRAVHSRIAKGAIWSCPARGRNPGAGYDRPTGVRATGPAERRGSWRGQSS